MKGDNLTTPVLFCGLLCITLTVVDVFDDGDVNGSVFGPKQEVPRVSTPAMVREVSRLAEDMREDLLECQETLTACLEDELLRLQKKKLCGGDQR